MAASRTLASWRKSIQIVAWVLGLCTPEIAGGQGLLGPVGRGCFKAFLNEGAVFVEAVSCKDYSFGDLLRAHPGQSDQHLLVSGDACLASVRGRVTAARCTLNSETLWSLQGPARSSLIQDSAGRCLTRAGGALHMSEQCGESTDQLWSVGNQLRR